MSEIIILIICTIAGGVIGGMGMGGGTLTIPLLTLFCSLTQHQAQAVNMIAFIPMATVTLIIHTKNKLVDYKKVLPVALPALVTGVACSFFALEVKGRTLAFCYGAFLTVLSVYQMTTLIITEVGKRGKKACSPSLPRHAPEVKSESEPIGGQSENRDEIRPNE